MIKCMKPKQLSVTTSTHVSSLEFLSIEQELASVRARKRFHSRSVANSIKIGQMPLPDNGCLSYSSCSW